MRAPKAVIKANCLYDGIRKVSEEPDGPSKPFSTTVSNDLSRFDIKFGNGRDSDFSCQNSESALQGTPRYRVQTGPSTARPSFLTVFERTIAKTVLCKTSCQICKTPLQGTVPAATTPNTRVRERFFDPVEAKEKWWARRDSNPQPSGYEPPALTIELQALRCKTRRCAGLQWSSRCVGLALTQFFRCDKPLKIG
ncbi:hypothetical protein QE369_003006 [Agrobacterium larrymoorei]|uniref:Uncharacterized protein n=1 Tax=Agrobacterium larrymoorei TaxID=160699 RepID=A0AAJ2BC30_9HYPH|nr:hypothetical protein [Agrobacterium larrymoorei]